MTILTALAVFTLGLIVGAYGTFRAGKVIIKNLTAEAHMSLMHIHRCADGHVHVVVRTSNSKESEIHLVLTDRTEQTELTEGVKGPDEKRVGNPS